MKLSSIKEQYLIAIVIPSVVFILILKKPIEVLLNYIKENTLVNDLVAATISRTFIIIAAVIFICNYPLRKINGIDTKFRITNIHAAFLPFSFCILFIIIKDFSPISHEMKFIFITSMLFVGIAEELVFRGIILTLMIKKSKRIILSVICSSLIFSLCHYINLIKEPRNFQGITSQAIFAFSIGIFFSGLFLRTGNIAIPAILHGLVDISLSSLPVEKNSVHDVSQNIINNHYWMTLMLKLSVVGLIALIGLMMIRQTSKEKILDSVSIT